MPYLCNLCAEAEPATVLVTPLSGGETMAIGADCVITGLCGLLSVAAQVDAEQLYDAIIGLRAAQDQAPAEGASGAQAPAGGPHRPQRAASVTKLPAGRTGAPRATAKARGRTASAAAPAVPESGPDIA